MRKKRAVGKHRACGLCKPQKVKSGNRWKAKDRAVIYNREDFWLVTTTRPVEYADG